LCGARKKKRIQRGKGEACLLEPAQAASRGMPLELANSLCRPLGEVGLGRAEEGAIKVEDVKLQRLLWLFFMAEHTQGWVGERGGYRMLDSKVLLKVLKALNKGSRTVCSLPRRGLPHPGGNKEIIYPLGNFYGVTWRPQPIPLPPSTIGSSPSSLSYQSFIQLVAVSSLCSIIRGERP